MSVLSTLVTPALIAMSCSHLSVQKDGLTNQQESLLLAYQKAKTVEMTDSSGSCSLYSRLSKEDFPLNHLALIRAHLICNDRQSLPPVPENLTDTEPWLTNLDLDRQILEAQKAANPRALTQAYFRKAQKSDLIRDKVNWLQLALETFKKIESPTAEDSNLQTDLQNNLYRWAPRFIPEPNQKQYLSVGLDLISQRQFNQGRDYLKKLMADSHTASEEQYQIRRAYRNSFKTEQKKDQYVEECGNFAHWLEKHSSPARVHEAYVTWARAQWTQGDAGTAQKILDKAEKVLKKSKYAMDEINFIRGRMAEERGDYQKALSLFNEAEKQSRIRSTVRDRILFSKAWMLRKQGHYAEAADSFTQLKAETQDPYDKNRYSFWRAKSLSQASKNEEAQKEFQELTQNDPLGYYGLVAYHETKTDIPALNLERKAASEEDRPSQIAVKDHALIRALAFADELEILGKFLDFKSVDLRNHQVQDSATWLYILKAYARAGLYNPLFAQMGNLPVELKNKLLSQNPELLFPRRFLDLIQASADKFGIKSELMLSIIRQESAFNPQARSGADALGLMQLLPSVAKQFESKTGIDLKNFEDLYKPEVNVPFGAALLSDLSKKYRGQFILIAAAYNANEKAIEGWLKTRLKEDPLEFIEDIPYEETRSYVKLVLRNFIFYSRLTTPGQKLAFPKSCLEDLQSFKVSTK